MSNDADPLQAQYDGIPVPCYTWRALDGGFVLERANREAHERTGPRLRTLLGRRVEEVYPDRADIADDLAIALAERRTQRREMEHTLATTGERRRLDVSYVFVPPDRVMVHADDVTEQRENEERLRAVIATIESGLLTVSPAGRVTDANPAACRILGLPRERVVEDPDWRQTLGLHLADGRSWPSNDPDCPGAPAFYRGQEVRDVELRVTRPDGDVAAVTVNFQPLRSGPDGDQNGLVVSLTDVTEARWLQERVAHQALHDPLTGLPNRLLFQERLEQALARAVRPRVVVLLIGLDRFRAINDAVGHQMGDELLVEAATRLHRTLDVAQPLARFGGDEFAVLSECEDERACAALAQRLTTAFEAPFTGGLRLSAAIGIAIEHPGHGAGELIQGADAAMQRVKARGGGAFEVFDRAMEGRLRDRLRIEDGLWRAIERDELRLMYQPIFELDPFRVVAVEALVRWQHPEEGLLAPGRFLPVAEQDARLISAIGDWVLRRACVEAALFPVGVRVSVNVAARELGEDGFADRIAATLAADRHRARADRARDHRDDPDGGRRRDAGRARAARAARPAGPPRRLRHRLLEPHPARAAAAVRHQARPRLRRPRHRRARPPDHRGGVVDRPRRRARRRRRGRRDRGAARAAARRRLPLRAGLPARATLAARAVGRTAYLTSPVSERYSFATSAGSFLSRSTRASSSCIASSVSGFCSASIVVARSAPAF